MSGHGVSDGQLANETTFNSGFISRNSDSDTVAKLDLLNQTVDPASGADIVNLQKNVNALASALGIPVNQVYNYLFTWASTVVGLSSSSAKDKIEALVLKFRNTLLNGGHIHDGTDGQGPKLSITNVLDINQFNAQMQTVTVNSASGTSMVITSQMTGRSPGGTTTSVGVITTAPNNKNMILDALTQTFIEDTEGQRVYGRITESAGTWTLSFFTNEGGTETPYNLASTNISVYFLEVFTLASVPTIPSNPALFGTLDVTGDVVDASATVRGVMNLLTQSFTGIKTFLTGVIVGGTFNGNFQNDTTTTGADQTLATPTKMNYRLANVSLTSIKGITATANQLIFILVNNTGSAVVVKNAFAGGNDDIITGNGIDMTMQNGAAVLVTRNTQTNRWHVVGGAAIPFSLSAVGTAPNDNGATYNTLTGAFNLEPASSTKPGVVTAGTQTFGGNKTFAGTIGASNLSGTNTGDVTLGAFGSTPDPKGATIAGQVLTLQPADLTNPGLISLLAQVMGAGDKTFSDSLIAGARFRGATATDSTTSGSTASIAAPAAMILRVTNAGLTGISKFSTPSNGQFFILVNLTGSTININNANAATDDIVTGTGAAVLLANTSSIILYYDTTSARWRIAGGSGSGGGGYSVTAVQTVTASGTITTDQNVRQLRYVKGSTGGNSTSNTPFGTGGWTDGTEIVTYGESDSDYLEIPFADINYGVMGNVVSLQLTNNKGMRYIWKNSALRWLASPL